MDLEKAARYNNRQENKLWKLEDMPPALAIHSPLCFKFAKAVSDIQKAHGLEVDGMLGPNTLKAIQTAENGVEELTHPNPLGPVLGGVRHEGPACLTVDDGQQAFEARKRSKPVEHIVIHESVTKTKTGCVRVLKRKGLGVHFMIDSDGTISQHCDPMLEAPAHANFLNGTSIGIEIINPYYPKNQVEPFELEPAQWFHHVKKGGEKKVCVPTKAQLEACEALVNFLCDNISTLPKAFPSAHLNATQKRLKGWKEKEKPEPGILAHRDFWSHADGRGILEHLMEGPGVS